MLKKNNILYLLSFFFISQLMLLIVIGICSEIKENKEIIIGFERMVIKEFAQRMNIDKDKIVNNLKYNGIGVKDANQPIYQIAINNEILPADIYKIITMKEICNKSKKDTPSVSKNHVSAISSASPYAWSDNSSKKRSNYNSTQWKNKNRDDLYKKYGKLTIKEVCMELDVSIKKAQKRLNIKGIATNNNEKLRDIAIKYNLRSKDIISIIKNK